MNGLKEKRKNFKMTLRDLGKQMNVTVKTISNYESGKREPNLEKLKKLSGIFNCSIEELL